MPKPRFVASFCVPILKVENFQLFQNGVIYQDCDNVNTFVNKFVSYNLVCLSLYILVLADKTIPNNETT